MADDSFKVRKSLNIGGNTSATTDAGDIRFDTSDSKFKAHNGDAEEQLVRTGDLADMDYDNSSSGLTATNPQAAIDEVEGRVESAESDISTLEGRATVIEGDIQGLEGDLGLLEGRVEQNESDISDLQTNKADDSDLTSHTSSTSTHGVTGDIVGTSDAQTLTNKTLTSPVLDTGVSGTAIKDEDDMASNSATHLATQQSIKAYVDAAAGAPDAGRLIDVQVFTSSDDYDKTVNNPNYVIVEVVGAGGGGGGTAATIAGQSAEAGSGGGGGYAKKFIKYNDLSETETITVGTGGTGGTAGANNGGNGGASSFGLHCSTTGGGGGLGSAAVSGSNWRNGGSGGTASGGDLNISGGDGSRGIVINGTPLTQNTAGESFLSCRKLTGNTSAGSTGNNYGGGGTGANAGSGVSARAGGAGADGIVIVWEYE